MAITLNLPGMSLPNQPGLPSAQDLLAQGFNAINNIFTQLISNPLSLAFAPIVVPNALGQQLGAKLQSGTLQARSTNVTIPISGGFIQLQPSPTLVSGAQLVNNSAFTIGVTTPPIGEVEPDAGSAAPVPAGATYNFGPIDLSTIYIGNLSNLSPAKVTLYMEQ